MKLNLFSNTNIKEELIRTSTTPTDPVFTVVVVSTKKLQKKI